VNFGGGQKKGWKTAWSCQHLRRQTGVSKSGDWGWMLNFGDGQKWALKWPLRCQYLMRQFGVSIKNDTVNYSNYERFKQSVPVPLRLDIQHTTLVVKARQETVSPHMLYRSLSRRPIKALPRSKH
jgi:hypothetical protein